MTVYVRLIGEGVDVWRPVEGEEFLGFVRLKGSKPLGEHWEFLPGALVRCAKRRLDRQQCMVAVEDVDRARPALVKQFAMRAEAARRATTHPGVANLVDVLVARLLATLDTIGDHIAPAYVETFLALATAVDVAEALARRPEA